MAKLPRIPRPRTTIVVAVLFAALGVVLLFVPDTAPESTRSFPLWVLGAAFILFAVWLGYLTRVELRRRRGEQPPA